MTKKHIPELHIERSSDLNNFYYLAVLQYRKNHHLVIVDNITNTQVIAYVLDYAPQAGVDLKEMLTVVTRWFYENSDKYPLSIEFSKRGMTKTANKILRRFDLDHVTRMVGKDFKYNFCEPSKVRRRRIQPSSTVSTDISLR